MTISTEPLSASLWTTNANSGLLRVGGRLGMTTHRSKVAIRPFSRNEQAAPNPGACRGGHHLTSEELFALQPCFEHRIGLSSKYRSWLSNFVSGAICVSGDLLLSKSITFVCCASNAANNFSMDD